MFYKADLYLDITTPLSNDFTLVDLRGEEGLSSLFDYTVILQTPDEEVDFDAIVGEAITVTISMEDGGIRYINGVVGEWAREEEGLQSTIYYARLYPWLWQLTLTQDHRIFQNKSAPDIIEAVFSDLGFADYELSLQGQYDPREFCVQYRETAFNFVSRLMEEEGIFYFFTHEDGKHTLVLADDNSAFEAVPNRATAKMLVAPGDPPTDASIRTLRVEQALTTGKYAMGDYNFETPDTKLLVTVEGAADPRVYEYPGGFPDTGKGETRAGIRLSAHEANQRIIAGESYCRDFIAGYSFTLEGHTVSSFNTTYVLRRVSIHATQDGYHNQFVASPSTIAFRPQRKTPKPHIAGLQTALVVGKAGEEIWTDKYGRIKVQFHWDQEGEKDENSSCWIRVSQMWAGKSWGRLFLPRMGQEVIVSFLEGDPDRPLVTGAVYNATQTVPYTLPDDQTKSTVKTNSSKGGEGFNELRFEDKKDEEEIYIHAQRDMNTHVLRNRQTFVQEGDPEYDEEATDLLQVEGDRKVTIVGDGTTELHTNEGAFEQLVTKTFTLTVDGDTLTIEAKNDLIIKGKTVSIESTGGDVTIKSSAAMTAEATGDMTVKGSAVTAEASGAMTVKGGSTTVEGGDVTVDGGSVTIKGGSIDMN